MFIMIDLSELLDEDIVCTVHATAIIKSSAGEDTMVVKCRRASNVEQGEDELPPVQ